MTKFVSKFSAMPAFRMHGAVTSQDIINAEHQLKLTFSDEYREYLLAFGCASVYGHELTGLTDIQRLNVVTQTLKERQSNPHITNDLYVIEVTNIDGIIIWQSSTGKIFESIYDSTPTLIHKSLYDYI